MTVSAAMLKAKCEHPSALAGFLSKKVVLLRRFCKPLDMRLLRQMAKEHPIMITVEENGIGGFGSHGEPHCLPLIR